MEQNIRLDVNHMMADMLGSEYGVTQAQLAAMQDAAVKAQHAVEANRGTGWLGWMNLPYNQEEIVAQIEKVAEHVRKTFKYLRAAPALRHTHCRACPPSCGSHQDEYSVPCFLIPSVIFDSLLPIFYSAFAFSSIHAVNIYRPFVWRLPFFP